jgi:regulator of cell morphogenesis and NO signaling
MNTIEVTARIDVPFDSESQTYQSILPGSAGFNEWDINSLIDLIIKQYHFNTRGNVVVIYDLAQKVFDAHSEKHPELAKLVEALFLFFDDLLFHLKKEEQILFPNIIQLAEKKLHEGSFNYSSFGVIKEYTLTMQNEHREVIKQLEFFRQITDNYELPEDGSKSYHALFAKMKEFENEMIQHIQLENNFLFPKAIQMDEKAGLL